MKKIFVSLFLLCLTGLPSFSQELPRLSELPSESWSQMTLEGATCLYGAPYSFFVRPASTPTNKLMIFFEGGGACWDGVTCANKGQFASRYEVPEGYISGNGEGFFDYENAANPVKDYHAVFVPYCTGDVHSGDNVTTLDVPAGSVPNYTDPTIEVAFNGFNNAQGVLSWVYENVITPEQVLVSGCSAGGYGALIHAPYIMNHYADSRVVMLADASNGVSPTAWEGLQTWRLFDNLPSFVPGLANTTPEEYSTTIHLLETARSFPQNDFAQYNTALDAVQIGFYGLMTNRMVDMSNFSLIGQEWGQGLQENLDALEGELPNFYSYTAGGLTHCIVNYDRAYTYTVDGVNFMDWVGALLNGSPLEESPTCDITTGECFSDPE